MGRRGNEAEYVDRNREESNREKRKRGGIHRQKREERDGQKRKWRGLCRQKQGGKIWGEEEIMWNM